MCCRSHDALTATPTEQTALHRASVMRNIWAASRCPATPLRTAVDFGEMMLPGSRGRYPYHGCAFLGGSCSYSTIPD